MNAFSGDAVAERRLELRTDNGTIEVLARVGIPQQVGSDEWTCACITRFANEERSIEIHGGDSMQALQLAMATLDVELQHGAKRRRGMLYHFDAPFISIWEDSCMQQRRSTRSGRSVTSSPDQALSGSRVVGSRLRISGVKEKGALKCEWAFGEAKPEEGWGRILRFTYVSRTGAIDGASFECLDVP